jgi:hypothetical protein
VGTSRVKAPVKATEVKSTESGPGWPAEFPNLKIDGFFLEMLKYNYSISQLMLTFWDQDNEVTLTK